MTQIIDPNKVSRAAIGGGLGSAAQQLAQYYLKAADKLFPVIKTDGGRTGPIHNESLPEGCSEISYNDTFEFP